MVNGLDSVSIGRDLLINRTSSLFIRQGVLEVQRNINIPTNITFRTEADAFMLLSGTSQQKIAYPAGGTVEFKNLAVTNTNNFNHVMVTRGNITRNLNGLRMSGTCSNTNCTTIMTCTLCWHNKIFNNLITITQVVDRGVTIGNKPPLNTIATTNTTHRLSAIVSPSFLSQAVTWESEKINIATVSANGTITPRVPGTTKITVTSTATGRKDEFVLTVVEPDYTMNYNVRTSTGLPINYAHELLDDATSAFFNTFNISLVRGNSSTLITLDERLGPTTFLPCTVSIDPDDIENSICCITSCGVTNRCMQEHHRSSHHFIQVNQGDRVTSIFKFVDFPLCARSGIDHIPVNGMADERLGNTILVTKLSSYAPRTVAHEISHLFGARDETECSNIRCVMFIDEFNYISDRWCRDHFEEVRDGIEERK